MISSMYHTQESICDQNKTHDSSPYLTIQTRLGPAFFSLQIFLSIWIDFSSQWSPSITNLMGSLMRFPILFQTEFSLGKTHRIDVELPIDGQNNNVSDRHPSDHQIVGLQIIYPPLFRASMVTQVVFVPDEPTD